MKRGVEIDRDKVRAEARKLDGTGLRVWLDENTRPDSLRTVRQFHRDSLAGRYYQDFMVNSRNYM